MHRSARAPTFLLALYAMSLTGLARAADDEQEIPLDKVPKPVLAAVRKKFPDAKLESAARETEDGDTFYEVFIRHKGHEIYIVCEPEGKIVEIDRQITVKELPKPVAQALKSRFPKAAISSVEEVTEDDQVTYAVLLKHNRKLLHLLFDPKGKVLEEEPYDEK